MPPGSPGGIAIPLRAHLLLARVVLRIEVDHVERPRAVDLYDRLFRGEGGVRHVGGQVHELTATWNEDEPLPNLPVGAPVLIDRLDRGIAVLTNLT